MAIRVEADLSPDLQAYQAYLDYVHTINQLEPAVSGTNPPAAHQHKARLALQDYWGILQAIDFSKNKMLLLRLMNRADWMDVLELLEKKQLINGLFFFDKEKLLRIMLWLPKPILIKMLLTILSPERLIKMLPARELFKIMMSRSIQVPELLKAFKKLDLKYLQFILTKITGEDTESLSPDQVLQKLRYMNKRQLMDGMQMLPYKALIQLVSGFVKEDPTLLERISDHLIGKIFENQDKRTLIDMCEILPEHLIINMLAQLPDKYLMETAGQIEDKPFADYLVSRQFSLLENLASAEAA